MPSPNPVAARSAAPPDALTSLRDGIRATWSERYDMLDGWRGLAALAVVLHHVLPADLPRYELGHEAVILFFVISGYCILASAESCRARGLKFRNFMWRRVKRIYPPYLFSVLFFVATRLLKTAAGGADQLARPWYVWLQNLTLLQWPTLLVHHQATSWDNPSLFVTAYWSLNYEEQFYLIIGAIMGVALLWGKRLRIILVLLAVGLVWDVLHPLLAYGFFIEYWPHFALGAIVFWRLCRVRSRRAARAVDVGLVAFTAGCAAWALLGTVEGRRPGLELLVGGCFALTLIASRRWNDAFKRLPIARLLTGLGAISYSLYLIHQFNLNLVRAVLHRVVPFPVPAPLWVLMQICGHVLLACAFWYVCERPFLNRSLVPTRPRAAMPDAAPAAG